LPKRTDAYKTKQQKDDMSTNYFQYI